MERESAQERLLQLGERGPVPGQRRGRQERESTLQLEEWGSVLMVVASDPAGPELWTSLPPHTVPGLL